MENKTVSVYDILYKADPAHLKEEQLKKEHYQVVAVEIVESLENVSYFKLKRKIKEILKHHFSVHVSSSLVSFITNKILAKLEFDSWVKELKKNPELSGLEIIDECGLRLKVHDYFIVKVLDGNTYINDKLYYDVEEIDMEECLCDFMNHADVVYIQLKKKSFFRSLFKWESWNFIIVPKKKFNLEKYIKKSNIEMIFDNQKLIYDGRENK